MIADVSRIGSNIPLVARRTELTALKDGLRRARAAEPTVVLLSGDAGIGKTRILTELTTTATTENDVVFTGRCLDTAEASLPYLPFAEIARQMVVHSPELIDEHPALRPLLPGERSPDGELNQLHMFNAVHDALVQLTTDRTVVLGIEDLHWADRSSRDLFAFLASRLGNRRLMVVATYRSDDMHRRHPLRSTLTEVVRLATTTRVHLTPFAQEESRAFIRAVTDNSLDDDAVMRIAEASEGNPFVAEELVSAPSAVVPQDLADVLLARIEWLSAPTQQVMRLASVIGRHFLHRLIANASELPDAALDEALREAVTHNVLVINDSGEAYAFRHALLREALYADLMPGERSRLHRRLAAALTDADHPGSAAELAHHSLHSDDAATALAASVRAADEARTLAAPADVLRHLEHALDLWSDVPDPETVSGRTKLDVTEWAGQAAELAGEPDRATAHGRAAIEIVDRLDTPLESASVRRRYADYLMSLESTGPQAYDVATQAWSLVADSPPSLVKLQVEAVLARAARDNTHYEEAAVRAAAAVETARAIDEGTDHFESWADALTTYTTVVDRTTKPTAEVIEKLQEAIDLAQRTDAMTVELRARYQVVTTLHDAARFTESLAAIDAGLDRASSTGSQWSPYGLELRVIQVITRFMIGDWDGAVNAAESVGGAASSTVITRVFAPSLLVAVNRGEYDVATRRLDYLRDRWHTDQQVLTVVGLAGAEMETWRGNPHTAIEHAELALRRLEKVAPHHLVSLSLCAVGIGAYADLAAAARAAGDINAERAACDGGEALYSVAVEAKQRGIPISTDIGPEGLAWWNRVTAERSRLTGAVDPALWQNVAQAFSYGEPYRQAWAQWRQAEALLAVGGDRDAATECLRSAADVAQRLGAAPLLTAVTELSRRAGLDVARAAVAGPLTPREKTVLELAAQGMTNRQIGSQLYISEKTVSVHLSRAMTKLDASSRTEAVNTAHLRGLLG